MRQEENKAALFDEVYRLLCQARPRAAIYRQTPLPEAAQSLAANDEEWECAEAPNSSEYFARFVPLIAQCVAIFGPFFRKLKQKIFNPNFPAAVLATLILLGFVACSARGFAYDNMSGTPQILAVLFYAPLARCFQCAFRRADGQGYLLLQIPLHPKAAPGICAGYARTLAADNRQGGGL